MLTLTNINKQPLLSEILVELLK